MWDYIEDRVKKSAEYLVATGSTVRGCSAHFCISKSTVHKDVSERLKYIDAELFERVRRVLDKNLSERHIRGGIATKRKYEKAFETAERRGNSPCESLPCENENGESITDEVAAACVVD